MAMSRHIKPELLDSKYFDGMFKDMNSEIAHMHHDMRSAMCRITPRDLISEGDPVKRHLEKIREPIVTKVDGSKELCLQYDVGSFKPEEISVKVTDDRELQVEAIHEEKTENSRVTHKFSRHFSLPKDVAVDTLTSSLSKDGVLVVCGTINPPVEQGAKK